MPRQIVTGGTALLVSATGNEHVVGSARRVRAIVADAVFEAGPDTLRGVVTLLAAAGDLEADQAQQVLDVLDREVW